MTALLPSRLATYLQAHGLVDLSQIIGVIAVTFLLLLLATREVVRDRAGSSENDQHRHLYNAISLTLCIVVGVVIIERFLLLK
jgi:hypothetical protein